MSEPMADWWKREKKGATDLREPAQVRTFMPTEGFENCGNATLVAARAVPSRVPAGAVSASMPSLNLSSATFLELQFDAFGKCALCFLYRAVRDARSVPVSGAALLACCGLTWHASASLKGQHGAKGVPDHEAAKQSDVSVRDINASGLSGRDAKLSGHRGAGTGAT